MFHHGGLIGGFVGLVMESVVNGGVPIVRVDEGLWRISG